MSSPYVLTHIATVISNAAIPEHQGRCKLRRNWKVEKNHLISVQNTQEDAIVIVSDVLGEGQAARGWSNEVYLLKVKVKTFVIDNVIDVMASSVFLKSTVEFIVFGAIPATFASSAAMFREASLNTELRTELHCIALRSWISKVANLSGTVATATYGTAIL